MVNTDRYSKAIFKASYRTPSQIVVDIRAISERIAEINDLLNVRKILAEAISEESGEDIERKIESVSELVDFAGEALLEMQELEQTLDGLKKELVDAMRA